jgi:uncharacterized protein YggL (DUF469 family)
MRKRLRKKRGEGEFAGLAFGVSYVLDDVSTRRANEFVDHFVEAIEIHGLECRDGRREWDFMVARTDGARPSAEQREAVVGWLRSRRELARFAVENLD